MVERVCCGAWRVCLVLAAGVGCRAAHGDSLDDAIVAAVEQVRGGSLRAFTVPESASPSAAYKALKPYLGDPNSEVRIRVVFWMAQVLARAKEPAERSEGIDILLGVVAGPDRSTANWAAHDMLWFVQKTDFNNAQRKKIGELLPDRPQPDLIWLAGIAGGEDVKAPLRKFAEGNDNEVTRAAQLALGRMGDHEMSVTCVTRMGAYSTGRKAGAMDSLAYLRTPEAVELMKTWLMSDEGVPTAGDAIGFKLAVRVLEPMAKVVEGFPLPIKGAYTEKEMEAARQWVKEHPKLEVKE